MTDNSDPKRRRIIVANDQDEDDFGADGAGSDTERYERVNDRVSDDDSEVDSNPDALLQDDEVIDYLYMPIYFSSNFLPYIYYILYAHFSNLSNLKMKGKTSLNTG